MNKFVCWFILYDAYINFSIFLSHTQHMVDWRSEYCLSENSVFKEL